jgi:acyl-CoA synthetase (AMP-forming)/AMP-acid ligase II
VSGGEGGLAVRDGWLHTGDDGALLDGRAVAFRGVRKAMFTRNGFNIYPRELELAVAELPGIASASVAAVPDPLHENDIALTVTGSATEAEIRAWCEQRLSAYKQPASITIGATR